MLEIFKKNAYDTLQSHGSLKKRYVRSNQASFINKKINRKIMKQTPLRNKFLNSRSDMERKHTPNKEIFV